MTGWAMATPLSWGWSAVPTCRWNDEHARLKSTSFDRACRARLFAGDVPPQEDDVRGEERHEDVDRRQPDRTHDRCPVRRGSEEAVPRVELCSEQVRPDALGAGQH